MTIYQIRHSAKKIVYFTVYITKYYSPYYYYHSQKINGNCGENYDFGSFFFIFLVPYYYRLDCACCLLLLVSIVTGDNIFYIDFLPLINIITNRLMTRFFVSIAHWNLRCVYRRKLGVGWKELEIIFPAMRKQWIFFQLFSLLLKLLIETSRLRRHAEL